MALMGRSVELDDAVTEFCALIGSGCGFAIGLRADPQSTS